MYCKNCKTPVIVAQGVILKACKCNAPIIADMKAVVYSHGKINHGRV
jgi:hypothetical protein